MIIQHDIGKYPIVMIVISMGVSSILSSVAVGAELHVSPTGSDTRVGSKTAPLKTISAAASKAQPGDTITVHEGVYRERVNPPRGGTSDEKRIVYRAAPGEKVVIKGSEPVTGWTHVGKDIWRVTLPNSFFGDFNPYSDLLHGDWYEAKRPYHSGAVYLNGHWLKEAARKNLVVESASSGVAEDASPELMNIRQLTVGGKTLKAAEFTAASDGVETIKLPDGLTCVGRMRDGSTLTYDMDLGEEVRYLDIYAASPLEGGWIEIRKGGADGELLGRFDVGFTAEWTSFQPYHADLNPAVSGKQILTLVFKSRPQQPASKTADSAYWFAEVGKETTTIWAQFKNVDPNKELVEVNVRQCVFYPDQPGRNFITVKGFTLEQAATPWSPPTAEQIGLTGSHWSKGWVIEDNTIRYSTCAGITLGKDRDEMDNKHDMRATIRLALAAGWSGENVGHHVVRNNQIYNCGQAGLVGSLGGIFSTIEGNEIHDIRKDHNYGGCETAGIKMHGAVDVVIRDNHIYNCEHWGGIWLDWMAQGARVSGNLLHDNSQDMMLEVNHGPFLVDNNLLLSRQQVTKVSSSGAYVHNLWFDNFGLWRTEARQTPYFKPHSTEIIKEAAVNQSDDRFYNNIFVGLKGTAAMDEHGFSLTGSGNVFLSEAIPSKHEQMAIVAKDWNPQIQLRKESDGWWITMKVDPAWSKEMQRNVVTTELLGKPAVTGEPYEQGNGKPYQLDTDYFGNRRSASGPSPGPFQLSGDKDIRLKVWPK